jgi:hypothetical protein
MPVLHGIRIPRTRGDDEQLCRLADRLENYINEQVSASDEQFNLFAYGGIAIQLSVSREDIKELLRRVGGGRNGITVVKRPLTDL